MQSLVLLALLHHAGRDAQKAYIVLKRALTLAAAEGYARVFVDEGAPMAALLGQTTSRLGRTAPDASVREYADRLLAALRASAQHLALGIEPLTDREREVLCLLAAGRSNQAIAKELVVAVGTVKRHVSSIISDRHARRQPARYGYVPAPPAPWKLVTSAVAWMLERISPGMAFDGRLVIAATAAGSSLGARSAVSSPLVSCSVSVSWV